MNFQANFFVSICLTLLIASSNADPDFTTLNTCTEPFEGSSYTEYTCDPKGPPTSYIINKPYYIEKTLCVDRDVDWYSYYCEVYQITESNEWIFVASDNMTQYCTDYYDEMGNQDPNCLGFKGGAKYKQYYMVTVLPGTLPGNYRMDCELSDHLGQPIGCGSIPIEIISDESRSVKDGKILLNVLSLSSSGNKTVTGVPFLF